MKKELDQVDTIEKKSIPMMIIGFLLVLLGIVVISHASSTSTLSLVVVGCFLSISALLLIVHSFWVRDWQGVFVSLLVGIVSLIVGGFCLLQPLDSAMAIASLFGAFFLATGLIEMLTAGFIRFHHWMTIFVIGLVSFTFGAVIFTHWPFSAMWVLGVFVGANICLIGLTLIIFAESLKITK